MTQKTLPRREFLRLMGFGAGVATIHSFVPSLFIPEAHAFDGTVGRIAQIFLNGGNDAFTMCHASGNSSFMTAYLQKRPTLGQTLLNNSGQAMARLELGGTQYSLHPQLTALKTIFDEGNLAIINKFGTQDGNGSHEISQASIKKGLPNSDREVRKLENAGWIARVADRNFTDSLRVMDMTGGDTATLGGAFKPLVLRDLSQYGYVGGVTGESGFRLGTTAALMDRYAASPSSDPFLKAWNQVESTVDTVRTAYQSATFSPAFPTTGLGRQMRDIFIGFTGLSTRIGYAQVGGFDLHTDTDPQNQNPNALVGQSSRMKELNDAIFAFSENCKRAGIWADMALLVMSEFGRTTAENGNRGLDHGAAGTAFVLGGAVRGGIYGDEVTAADLMRRQNSIIATSTATDVYAEIVAAARLDPTGLVPPGYTPRNLSFIR